MTHTLIFIASFFLILAGSELFTNGIEWAGQKLGIAEAAVGSLLAAVGTALPETFIPAVALMASRGDSGAHRAVGTGAIIGAPLMLSTVAPFVMGVAVLGYRERRGRPTLEVPYPDAKRDLGFFLPIFLAIVLCGLGRFGQTTRCTVAIGLLIVYALYCVLMLRIQRDDEAAVEHGLYLEMISRGDPLNPRTWLVAIQVIGGTAAILIGAEQFVDSIVRLASHTHINPGLLSLIISPFATELPEKYNSVVWIRKGKDHLAFANISGAMVFQSCIPAALGIVFTPWHLSSAELIAGGVALAATAMLFVNVAKGPLKTSSLMLGGAAYVCFLILLATLGGS
ncbi:MAG: sodium:calcium antiporter [Candidatus Binataceae bacterium]